MARGGSSAALPKEMEGVCPDWERCHEILKHWHDLELDVAAIVVAVQSRRLVNQLHSPIHLVGIAI